jgi:hypothetical protein
VSTDSPEYVPNITSLPAVAFLGACLATAFFALYPGPHHPSVLASDKAEHFIAFAVLNVTLLLAAPRTSPILLALGLAAAGVGVEVLQSTAMIGRDSELKDWLIELPAIALSSAAVLAAGLRRRLVLLTNA